MLVVYFDNTLPESAADLRLELLVQLLLAIDCFIATVQVVFERIEHCRGCRVPPFHLVCEHLRCAVELLVELGNSLIFFKPINFIGMLIAFKNIEFDLVIGLILEVQVLKVALLHPSLLEQLSHCI